MKTSELLNKINETEKSLLFQLPEGDLIKGDLHITEVKNVHVDSTDCGGFKHSFQETVIQLWLNEDSPKEEDWTTTKAAKIFDIVGNQREYLLEADAFIEFGDSNNVNSKYGVEFDENDNELKILLNEVYPLCKPRTLMQNSCC
jgi:hypothetical protein